MFNAFNVFSFSATKIEQQESITRKFLTQKYPDLH